MTDTFLQFFDEYKSHREFKKAHNFNYFLLAKNTKTDVKI